MPDQQYYPSQVQAWMRLAAQGDEPALTIPISSFAGRFALNTIPTATVSLAVGVDAFDPRQRSNAHRIVKRLRKGAKLKVYAALEGDAGVMDGKVVQWPGLNKPFCIFDGKISTANPEAGNGLRCTLGLNHWLSDLESTCWISSVLDPGAADALFRPTGWNLDPSGQGPAMCWLDATNTKAIESNRQDVWGKVIKPWLVSLAKNEQKTNEELIKSKISFLRGLLGAAGDNPNTKAVAALERMDDPAHVVVVPAPLFGNVDRQYAEANAASGNNGMLSEYMKTTARLLWSMEGSPTLWSKLIQFARFNMLGICPTVESATVMPWVPVLNVPWVELTADDTWSFVGNAYLPRSHRGVVLLPLAAANTNTKPEKGAGAKLGASRGIVGLYDVLQTGSGIPAELIGEDPGTLAVQFAPPWMGAFVPRRTPDAFVRGIRSALHPGKPDPAEEDKAAQRAALGRTIGDALAKALFMVEALKMRAGGITSRLRFDVAPGSTIRFTGTNPDFDIPGYTADGMMANVAAVHIDITASDGASCRTTFEISHVRMAHEAPMCVDEHPLFRTAWRGSPLVNIPGVTPKLVP